MYQFKTRSERERERNGYSTAAVFFKWTNITIKSMIHVLKKRRTEEEEEQQQRKRSTIYIHKQTLNINHVVDVTHF